MFNLLTNKKLLFFVFPLLLVLTVVFLAYEVSVWRAEAALEKHQKEQWQEKYTDLNGAITEFNKKQTALLAAIEHLETANRQTQEEIGNALQNNQTWSNEPVPDDIKRVFNRTQGTD